MANLPTRPDEIAARTLEHYDRHAEDFREGTRDHDVSQNIAALLRHIEGESPFTILDLGCGPGRDLATFARLGHQRDRARWRCTLRRDGARRDRLCRVASGLPRARICPSGTSMASSPTPRCSTCRRGSCRACLKELRATLRPGGVLFSSNPRGANEEGWSHGRYGVYHDLETWRRHMTAGASWSSSTTTGPPACRALSSRGWRACGAGPDEASPAA